MQEKINGFKKVTQSYDGTNFSTEISGNDVRVTGANLIDVLSPIKVGNLTNGYGLKEPLSGNQKIYTWSTSVKLTANNVGDSITIYDGTSTSQSLNPFARIFGDDFNLCVIWPAGIEIYGNGFDSNNYISATIDIAGTNWMYDDSTYSFVSNTYFSYNTSRWNLSSWSYPYKANESVITAEVTSLSANGSPLASDKDFDIVFNMICQKIDL